jgi:hypothetical protein
LKRLGFGDDRVKIVHGVDVVNFNVALNDKDFSSSYSTGSHTSNPFMDILLSEKSIN